MRKLKMKIINCSGVEIQLVKLVLDIQIGGIIIIAPNHEHEFASHRDLEAESIRLHLPHHCIFLNGDFIHANKIAYVRKGDGDCWFVDPVHRAAKLVRKHVYNSTISPIALVECVLERTGETKRVPGNIEKIDAAMWTAWSEIIVASKTKCLLIVDPKGHRKYFVRRGGGPSLFGSIDEVMLRQQNNNVNGNLCEIIMTQHNEYAEVKEHSDGMLELTSSWRPPCLV